MGLRGDEFSKLVHKTIDLHFGLCYTVVAGELIKDTRPAQADSQSMKLTSE
jgi:hypothetical protein